MFKGIRPSGGGLQGQLPGERKVLEATVMSEGKGPNNLVMSPELPQGCCISYLLSGKAHSAKPGVS